jgi:hypothetical protein
VGVAVPVGVLVSAFTVWLSEADVLLVLALSPL